MNNSINTKRKIFIISSLNCFQIKNFKGLFRILPLIAGGILFSTNIFSADYYWVGGTGNWSAFATHWATTSNGTTFHTSEPTPTDNVFFDASSFSGIGQQVTVDAIAYCNSMNWTGATNTPRLGGASDLHINGSLTFITAMNITAFTGIIYFESSLAGQTITSAGRQFNNDVHVSNVGQYQLSDAFNTTGGIYLDNGQLDFNSQNVTAGFFSSNNSNIRSLLLGNSAITITGYYGWYCNPTGFTGSSGSSVITLTYAGTVAFNGGSQPYYNLIFNNGIANTGYINDGGNTFNNVTFNGMGYVQGSNNSFNKVSFAGDGTVSGNGHAFSKLTFLANGNIAGGNNTTDSLLFTAGKAYTLGSGNILTINNYLGANGTCSQPITLQSNYAGNQAIISKSAGNITVNYVVMKDIQAMGGAVFTANNISDFGNNSGWTINAPASQNLYWIGGTGNWNDPSHWSTSSGGAAGACIPTQYDNVIFDANSFSGNGEIVTINVIAYCKNMDWSAITKTPLLSGTIELHIHGSLAFSSLLNINNYTAQIFFDSKTAGNTIVSAGKKFFNYSNTVNFNGTGEWSLQDDFQSAGDVNLNFGSLKTNGKKFTCNGFSSNNNNMRSFILGNSEVALTGSGGVWNTGGNSFTFTAGNSVIKATQPNTSVYVYAGTFESFNEILFESNTSNASINGGAYFGKITFNSAEGTVNATNGISLGKVVFNGNGIINNTLTFDTLIFAPGGDYSFPWAQTQTINKYFEANGTCSKPIVIHSNFAANKATISKLAASGNVALNYVSLQDMNATGGATFTANNSINAGNNTGWIINAPTASVTAGYTYSKNGLTLSCTNASTGNPSCYYWDFGDGTYSTQASPMHLYNIGGQYNVCLISSDCCNIKDTVCQTIGINCASPVAGFSTTINGLNITITNSSAGATSASWNFGDGNTSSAVNPGPHTYFSSGTYTISLIAGNGCGSDTVYKTVTVTCTAPTSSFSHSVNGLTVNFNNTSTNASVSAWNFGDSQTSGSSSPSHVYNTPGTYTVTLIVSNGCGTDTVIQSVTVVCATPSANYISSANGLSVDFVSTSLNTTTVSWNFGDGSPASILPAVNHAYAASGTYTVCLTANNGCGSDTFCTSISVCTPPTASFTISVSALTANFTNTSSNGMNYVWNFGDMYATNSVSPSHTYNMSGTYTVCLTASNSCGSDTVCSNVVITCSPFTGQSICLVTVDSTSSKNVLVWEKPVTTSIDSFRIYREFGLNNYVRVGSVDYDSLSQFTDNTAGVNPNVQSYRYKISFVDTCGNESTLSSAHRTIHLITPQLSPPTTFDLVWGNDYEGFFIAGYNILRDGNNTGIFDSIAYVTFGNKTFTDIAPTDSARYKIEVVKPGGCNVTIKNPDPLATTVKSSKSNTSERITPPVSVHENALNEWIKVYPNPNRGQFTIYSLPLAVKEKYKLRIFNSLGEMVYETLISSPEYMVSLPNIANGIYQLKVTSDAGENNRKLVISR